MFFSKTGLTQRAANSQFLKRAPSGAIVNVIGCVGSVADGVKTVNRGLCTNGGKNGFFTVVASIEWVGCNAGIVQNIEVNDLQVDTACATENSGIIEFKCGLERGMNAVGFGFGGKTPGAFDEKRGVASARKADGTVRMIGEEILEPFHGRRRAVS